MEIDKQCETHKYDVKVICFLDIPKYEMMKSFEKNCKSAHEILCKKNAEYEQLFHDCEVPLTNEIIMNKINKYICQVDKVRIFAGICGAIYIKNAETIVINKKYGHSFEQLTRNLNCKTAIPVFFCIDLPNIKISLAE